MTKNKIKSIFITGGTSGIGLDLAILYLKAGFVVGVCGRNEEKILELGKMDIPNFHNLIIKNADVANKTEVQGIIEEFYQTFGLNILVANAGVAFSDKKNIPDFTQSQKIIDINITGFLNTFEKGIEIFLKEKSGHLVATSSLAGYLGMPGVSAYAASKGFVKQICESYYLDLNDKNINVTCVCPGYVKTALTSTNRHKMPFLMNSADAAKKIKFAIDQKKMVYAFPLPLFLPVKFLSLIPRKLFFYFMKGLPWKFSRKV